jgi:hypothetical protein
MKAVGKEHCKNKPLQLNLNRREILCYHPFKVFFIGPTSILFVQVNLKKGTITVPPGEGEVVHNICLAFVTATLYLLVQPRPRIIEKVRARARARERVRKMVRARAGEPARVRTR